MDGKYLGTQLGYIFLYGSMYGLFTYNNLPLVVFIVLLFIGFVLQIQKYITCKWMVGSLLKKDILFFLLTNIISVLAKLLLHGNLGKIAITIIFIVMAILIIKKNKKAFYQG